MRIIKFTKCEKDMKWAWDSSRLKTTHALCDATDYTLCGHATDEYSHKEYISNVIITCPQCSSIIRECRTARLKNDIRR